MNERGTREVEFLASRSAGVVHGLLEKPAGAVCLLVLAHGAGAGMRHPFLESMARSLAERRVATLRWQFPYMEKGSRRIDPKPILLASIRSAVAKGAALAGDLPLFAGGKSMGGRMTSMAQAAEPLPGVRGIAFLGFPLHAAGKPSAERGAHLQEVQVPMLFLQGTRDALADLALLRPITDALRARATLRIFDDADHSFHVRKSSGRTNEEVMEGLASAIAEWTSRIAAA